MTAIPPASDQDTRSFEDKKASACYSSEEISLLDPEKIPHHIAIIMDGNRRWARSERLQSMAGHWEGAELLTEIVLASAELGVETLTVFAFSTENWSRPDGEIEALMELFEFYLINKREMMKKEGIRFDVIGDLSRLSPKIRDAVELAKSATEQCTTINLVLALNYGGRDELCRAMMRILELHDQRGLHPEELTEDFVGSFLDTHRWGDPALVIRTGGGMRISNFLLWQISYSEIYVTNQLWPDFTPKELLCAILDYQSRLRTMGR